VDKGTRMFWLEWHGPDEVRNATQPAHVLSSSYLEETPSGIENSVLVGACGQEEEAYSSGANHVRHDGTLADVEAKGMPVCTDCLIAWQRRRAKEGAFPVFLVTLAAAKGDFALLRGSRGARKWVVTDLFVKKEEAADQPVAPPPEVGKQCPVLLAKDTEIAVFNQFAAQDRHMHMQGTEIYMPIEGTVTLEVEGKDYCLLPGDMLIVNPGVAHMVRGSEQAYLCRVVCVNCGGVQDKKVVDLPHAPQAGASPPDQKG